jgi:hypothetical protein
MYKKILIAAYRKKITMEGQTRETTCSESQRNIEMVSWRANVHYYILVSSRIWSKRFFFIIPLLVPHGGLICTSSSSSNTSLLSSVILVSPAMPRAREHEEEVEEARCKGPWAYFALGQHQRDEEDPTRAEACTDAGCQWFHFHLIPSLPSMEENVRWVQLMSCYFDTSSYAEQMDATVELIFIDRHIGETSFWWYIYCNVSYLKQFQDAISTNILLISMNRQYSDEARFLHVALQPCWLLRKESDHSIIFSCYIQLWIKWGNSFNKLASEIVAWKFSRALNVDICSMISLEGHVLWEVNVFLTFMCLRRIFFGKHFLLVLHAVP